MFKSGLSGLHLIAIQPGGLTLARIYPLAEGLSPGMVSHREAAGSGKESTKFYSNTSQGSSILYNTETFSLYPPGGHGVARSA